MGLFDNVFPIFSKSRKSKRSSRQKLAKPLERDSVSDFGGTRMTVPKFVQGGGGLFGALPRKTRSELGLDDRSLSTSSIDDLMDILMDAHPDLSFALWNFIRLGTVDYNIKVYKLGSGNRYPQGERAIEEFIRRLEMPNPENFELSRSIDRVINQLFISTITRGAAALELVLTPRMDDVAFLAPVDPSTISFKFENNRYIPYQDDEKISLDIPTFFYEALDDPIDNPYGRSPFLSAITVVMFQLQVLNDIKAVVHNQGYPRFDITILEQVLLDRMPIHIRNNEEEKQAWLEEKLNSIIRAYNSLEPDDTFVHYDSVKIDMVGGNSGGGAMIDPQKLMNAIDSLIMSGLKTLSTILGRRATGNTESFAKLETKLYLKGVKAIQSVVERILSRALTMYLNIIGKQGIVKFEFVPIEIRTELEQAQFEQIALQNYAYMRDQGWIDQNEAANRAVGKDAVSDPDWEHLGKSTIRNKDGSPTRGSKDEKATEQTDNDN